MKDKFSINPLASQGGLIDRKLQNNKKIKMAFSKSAHSSGHSVAETLRLVCRDPALEFLAPLKLRREHFTQRRLHTKLFPFQDVCWLCLKTVLSFININPPLLQNFLEILNCFTEMVRIRKATPSPIPFYTFIPAAVLLATAAVCKGVGGYGAGRQTPPNCMGKSMLSNNFT